MTLKYSPRHDQTDGCDSTRLTRKQFLRSVGTLAASVMIPTERIIAQQRVDQEMRNRVASVLREYDSQGDHRTGTAVDAASGQWLSGQIFDIGLETELEWMGFSKIDVHSAYVEVDGRWAEGVPTFDGSFTNPDGVTGRLGSIESNADIGVVQVGPRAGQEFPRYRRETAHRAAIAVTGGPANGAPEGIALMNAPSFKEPYGPVILQVASEHHEWIQNAAVAGSEARVVAHVSRRPEEVFNVTATIRGTRPTLPPLIVMTPRSGWWTCASERGGGIAVWLEMMRSLRVATPARSSVFVASTGHELGHYGLSEFIRTRAPLIANAAAWIHLGANFGAKLGGSPRLQVSHDKLQSMSLQAMEAAAEPPERLHPVGELPAGEVQHIHSGGGRYISLVGSNGLFHHPHDRWPGAVDVDRVTRFAQAFVDIAAQLTRE